MDVNKLSPGQRIAAIAGGLLFIDLWMHWYSAGNDTISVSATAWQAFSWTDILTAIVALIAVSGAVFAATSRPWPLPIAWSQLTTIAGALITLLILYRIVNQPGPNKIVNVEWGAYIGFLLAAVMTYGAWRSSTEDATSVAAPPPAPTPAV